MTTKILDRSRPFGVVVGSHEGAVHYQDGVSFGGDDREIGAPPVADENEPSPVTTPPDPPPPGGPAVDPGVERDELEVLHPSQIKKLVLENGLVPAVGQGSKAKNIDLLMG